MPVNDPIADMLVRIRSGANAKHPTVAVPYSKIKESIAHIMKSEGFLRSVDVAGETNRKSIIIELKYGPDGSPVFNELRRMSKLGRRMYVTAADIKSNRQGVGVAILSTSKGVMKDIDAKRQGVGGEVLCTIW